MLDKTKATGVLNQVILYAKNHYGMTESGVVNDICSIMEAYTGIDKTYAGLAKEVIAEAFAQYVTGHDLVEGIIDILGIKWAGFPNMQRDPYDIMIGKLSIIEGHFVNMDEKMDMRLD